MNDPQPEGHMASYIGRREFIVTLGRAAAAWPVAARAQQPAMPVVGVLSAEWPNLFSDRLRAFHDGLRETGYVEGRNLAIEYRWAEGRTVNEIVKGESAARLVYPRAWPRAVSCRRNLPPAQKVI